MEKILQNRLIDNCKMYDQGLIPITSIIGFNSVTPKMYQTIINGFPDVIAGIEHYNKKA